MIWRLFPFFSVWTCTWAPDQSRLIEMVLMRGHNVCFIENWGYCLCVVFGIPYFLKLCHPTYSSVGGSCPRRSRYDSCCSGVISVRYSGWYGACERLPLARAGMARVVALALDG